MFPSQIFKVESMNVSFGVSDQPKSDKEVLNGAEIRAMNARKEALKAD